ncbi:acyltransferase family protein [Massilia yuzhufengensis]|uniref:Peptidoglycan/LPS O-acetylase OafA/YrhL, contains acyltransferase and SGNH-hydrolase domains n=1 Tax=Massilia yuzhufengensis TaxID=1164594 RepID=A0A1I1VQ95_9BURK|nr:acyltransferase [Massilia yuzhufengensis]SFD85025.1 Peptidoglycan/LPS O-acetylase OafA/YrhL, contains acyltransferase and SGNH-hydrolase domains [Massilia yuzhufengensis]
MHSLNIQYNPRIDQLRWLAATLVFLFHFHLEYAGNGGIRLTGPWTALVTEGHTGVGLFFTLSGFLFMQIALHQGQIVYKDFLRNRLLRILPLYLVIFLVATSIGRDKFAPQDLLYLFASNLGLAPTSGTVITGAAWTISLEFLFYMVFPFLARFTMERGIAYLGGWLLLMAFFKVAAYTVNDNSTLMFFSTWVGRFDQFLIGMAAAMLVARWRAPLARFAPVLLVAAIAFVMWDTALMHRVAPFGAAPKASLWIWWSMVESAGWAALIVAWVSFQPRLPGVVERALSQGGKVSFSFYLLHMGLLHIFATRIGLVAPTGMPWVDAAIMLAVAYGATWGLSTLCYHIVEEPFLRMRRNYGSRDGTVGWSAPPTARSTQS